VGGVDLIWNESVTNWSAEQNASELPDPFVLEVSPIFEVNPPMPKDRTGPYKAFRHSRGFRAVYWGGIQYYVDAMVLAEVERHRRSRRVVFVGIDGVVMEPADHKREAVEGSMEALLALRRAFFIRFLTARGSQYDPFETTREWLDRNGFEYDDLIIVNETEAKLAHLSNESLLIDGLADGLRPQDKMVSQLRRSGLPFEIFDGKTNNWRHISDRLLVSSGAPKFCVFSASIGDYAKMAPLPPAGQLRGLEFFLFVEAGKHRQRAPHGWTLWPVHAGSSGLGVALQMPKIFAHRYAVLRQCTVTLYVDADTQLKVSPQPLIEQFLGGGADIALFSISQNFEEEQRWLPRTGFAKDATFAELVRRYKREGFSSSKVHHGKVLMRRMNVRRVEDFEETWFREYSTGDVWGDQLFLSYAIWRHGLRVHDLGMASKMEGDAFSAEYLPAFTDWFASWKSAAVGASAAVNVGTAIVTAALWMQE